MSRIDEVVAELQARPRTWLITGVAGFIGSNLLERLLAIGQRVVGLDSLVTGFRANLDEVLSAAGPAAQRFRFIEGDIRDGRRVAEACKGVDVVLHQAALGSVPRSVKDPLTTNSVNVEGFLTTLLAARDAGVRRFVYASSSSVYGDHPALPKLEPQVGRLLSPYAITKRMNEEYAQVSAQLYGMEPIGLRYFNVFGPRQDPNGAYAAVLPRWVSQLLRGEPCFINGDGETSRDFCFVDNVVQANLLAATAAAGEATNTVYNVAVGQATTLKAVFDQLRERLVRHDPRVATARPVHRPFREGDIRHSLADIRRAQTLLGYAPRFTLADGLDVCLDWYVRNRDRLTASTR